MFEVSARSPRALSFKLPRYHSRSVDSVATKSSATTTMYPHANGQSATRLIYNKSRYIIKTGLGGTTYLPSRVRAVSTKAFAPGTFYIPYSNGQTAMRVLYDNLQWLKFDKWGYVLYRCTYDDDHAWAKFKDIICERARQRVILDETPEALDMLDFTGIEDKKELNGISRAELRVRHKRWAAVALLRENPRASPEILSPWVERRYQYSIQVDEEVLRSVVYEAPQPPDMDAWGVGYVKLVDAEWKSSVERRAEAKVYVPESEDDGDDELIEDDAYEMIDGCDEYNVGWMMVAAKAIGPDLYASLEVNNWHVFYRRPYEVVTH